MQKNIFKNKFTAKSILSIGTILSVMLFSFLAVATNVKADLDPAGCFSTGGSVTLTTYRADGVTPVAGGTVADGELIKYQATLGALVSPTVCAYQSGTWTLTTADGVIHNITPGGGVPRIGGTGVASIDSVLVSYTVNHADEFVNGNRHITSSTLYSGGFSHKNDLDNLVGPTLGTFGQTIVIHPTVTTTNIHDTNHTVITSALIGATVHDQATVPGEIGGPVPTGTVDFSLYPNMDCSLTPTIQAGVSLVAGVAESGTTSVPNTGMSYKANYNGDVNYTASIGACEPLTATKLTPTSVTSIHNTSEAIVTSVQAGSTVHDSAIITGSGPVPTGTADFTFYTDNTCTAGATASGTGIALVAGVAHPSLSQGPLLAGLYSFKAHYNGDENYLAGDAACEPLNAIAQGHITVDKITNPIGNTQSFAFTTTGTGYNAFSLTDTATPNDQTLVAGSYSVLETPVAGWTQTSATCLSGQTSVNPASITLAPGQTVNCTFTNTLQTGHIIIVKDAVPNDAQDFLFTNNFANSNPATFNLDDDSDNTLSNSRNSEVLAGTYAVSEGAVSGWTATSATCSDQSPIGAIVVSAGETVTCTFINTLQAGHLIVQKTTSPAADTTIFTINASGTGTITGGGAGTITDATDMNYTVTAGTYSVSETIPTGWAQTSSTCSNVAIAAGETKTCLVVNTLIPVAVQYCSPGYWKQDQHFGSYVTYLPTTLFGDVFENAFPGKTLLQVLWQGGGGLNMLGRATVGGLLNSTSMNTGMTVAQVIAAFNAVYPGTNTAYQATAATFTALENCPLGRNPAPTTPLVLVQTPVVRTASLADVLLGTLAAEDFGVVSYDTGLGMLKGYTAGFGVTDATFAGATSVVTQLYAGTTLLQTNTAILSKFNADITGTQFSSPFDVSGNFAYATDGYWTNVRGAEYGQSIPATRVVATVTLANGKVVTAENTTMTGDPTTIFLPGSLAAEDFGVMDSSGVMGYTAGFGLTDATFANVQSVIMQLYSGTTLLQTNTATSQVGIDITGIQISSPFDVFGTFNYVTDGYWTNVRGAEYGQTLIPTRVVATATLENGKIVTAENTNLTGDPTTIFPVTQMLTVNSIGSGTGTITSTLAGIDCGIDCTQSYPTDTSVTLTATSSTGSTFTGWSGDCTGTGECVIVMDNATSVTSAFTLDTVVVTSPTDKNQCKAGGWKTFTNPTFKNQGQCVSSVSHN